MLEKALCLTLFAQKYIITVSQCGSLGSVLAIKSEEQCRQSSAGKYCLSVDIGHITNCCGSSINCSIACRNCLTDFSCCLKPYMDILEQNLELVDCPLHLLVLPHRTPYLLLLIVLPVHPVKFSSALIQSTFAVMAVLSCES